MELIIYSPSEDGFITSIEFNKDELKNELKERLEKYKGLVYNDNEIKLAKSDRANLNKFKEALEGKRKEVKRQCLNPYERFEIDIKELIELVDKPIREIDEQVKEFENKQKEEKREVVTGVFNESIGNLKDILPLTKLWNPKWLNATYKLPAITEEIIKGIERVKNDLKHIEDLKTEYEVQMKDRYLETLLLSEALALKTRLEEQKKKLEEYKRQQEEKSNISPAAQPDPQPVHESHQTETKLEIIDFRVKVTQNQKNELISFIQSSKIKCVKAPIDKLKKFLKDLSPYCDTCANECGSSSCDECHRKYNNWRIDENILNQF
jgi:hypothetical protein